MSSLSINLEHPFFNLSGGFRKTEPTPTTAIENSVIFNSNINSQNIEKKLESIVSSIITISLSSSKTDNIDHLLTLKEPYVIERNKIFDNPFKYYNPFYRKRLRELEQEIDELDMKIYSIQRENFYSETELKEIVLSSEERLKKCFDLLQQ